MHFKLLLKLLLVFSIASNSYASYAACNSIICKKPVIPEHLQDWADSSRDQALKIMQKEVLSHYKQLQTLRGREKEYRAVINPDPTLRVFVSSSMSKTLLSRYCKLCAKYNCVLVFKGLPHGSFKELYRLIADISNNENNVAMQIDDEKFDQFGVATVPTIILSKENECVFNNSCNPKYDKIIGNIGIKKALEQFATNGDLKKEAKKILRQAIR